MSSSLVAYQWDFGVIKQALPLFADGIKWTVLLAAVVMALSLFLGAVVALLRLSRFRSLRAPAYLYTELFRTTPLLVQIIWFFWVFPLTFHLDVSTFWIGVLALTLNVSSFLAEIFRGAILSIEPGQRESALSTGMTEWTA